jgi:hypothetical protein
MNPQSTVREQQPTKQSAGTIAERISALDDEAMEASLSDALQHAQLGGHVQAVRFTPTARMEAPHVVNTVTGFEPAPELHRTHNDALESATDREQPEHARSRKMQDAGAKESPSDEPTLTDNTTMESYSDSEYIPSQDLDSGSSQQIEEDTDGEEKKTEEEEEDEAVEEHTDLEYQIPADVLRAAMQASPNTRASFWSANMYRGPQGQVLAVHYCQTLEVAERVAQHFLNEKVLGFDIEWKPHDYTNSIKKNASLVQLASEDRIALFHISRFSGSTVEKLMPPTLKTILESPDILKVGVAVKGDFSRLQKYLDIQAQGVFELSRLHNLVELHATEPTKMSNKLFSLAKQVHQHLQLPLYKGEPLSNDPETSASVRESDWSKLLNKKQIHYAAADAYAGFRLYHMLEWKRKQLRPSPASRGLCDYDAKAKPKVVSKKKVPEKAVDLSKAVAEETITPLEQKSSDAEEEEGYETAPEEFMDSHELEVPTGPEPGVTDGSTGGKNVRTQKRISRVNLAWLRGPDPFPWGLKRMQPLRTRRKLTSNMINLRKATTTSIRRRRSNWRGWKRKRMGRKTSLQTQISRTLSKLWILTTKASL